MIPKKIRISARLGHDNGGTLHSLYGSDGTYNGTTNSNVFFGIETQASGGGATGSDNTNIIVIQLVSSNTVSQKAVATFDATNITLTWTNANSFSLSETINIEWEAEA